MAHGLPWRLQQTIALASVLSCAAIISHAAEPVLVQARRQGDAVQVHAQATIKAPHDLIWQTLTDYDRLAEFVPDLSKSRVLDRRGNQITVELSGQAHFWFFSYRIDVVVESTEQQPNAIGMRLLKGNLKQLDGGYQIEKIDGNDDGFLLRWSGVIEPDIPVPLVIAMPVIRSNIAEQFAGMVREIERREARRALGKAG